MNFSVLEDWEIEGETGDDKGVLSSFLLKSINELTGTSINSLKLYSASDSRGLYGKYEFEFMSDNRDFFTLKVSVGLISDTLIPTLEKGDVIPKSQLNKSWPISVELGDTAFKTKGLIGNRSVEFIFKGKGSYTLNDITKKSIFDLVVDILK